MKENKRAIDLASLKATLANVMTDALIRARSGCDRKYRATFGDIDADYFDFVQAEAARFIESESLLESDRRELHWLRGSQFWLIGENAKAEHEILKVLQLNPYESLRKKAIADLRLIREGRSPLDALE